MGCFSFLTNDTNKSILIDNPKKIYMIDNKGNIYIELKYEGDGCFGGKDIYLLFAEMNNIELDIDIDRDACDEDGNIYDNKLRDKAIGIWFDDINNEYIYPNILENICDWVNIKPKDAPGQGFW